MSSTARADASFRGLTRMLFAAKFLVGRDGEVLSRYAPPTSPESFEKDIIAALAKVAVLK